MAAISQTILSNTFPCMTIMVFSVKIHIICSYKDPIINKSALVRAMAWRR